MLRVSPIGMEMERFFDTAVEWMILGLYGTLKEDEEFEHVRKVGLKVQNLLYVVDYEAVERDIVKIRWFDEFGKIIWDNLVVTSESDFDVIPGRMMDGQGFAELVGENSKRGDEISL
jgi:hypothetical protein